MVDTLLHLPSKNAVSTLLAKVHAALEAGGKLIVTFRDLSKELAELDRFIPVRSDADTIFTCFLEYEPDTVKVHDLVYRRQNSGWVLHKSFYRKLRLAEQWLVDQSTRHGVLRRGREHRERTRDHHRHQVTAGRAAHSRRTGACPGGSCLTTFGSRRMIELAARPLVL